MVHEFALYDLAPDNQSMIEREKDEIRIQGKTETRIVECIKVRQRINLLFIPSVVIMQQTVSNIYLQQAFLMFRVQHIH